MLQLLYKAIFRLQFRSLFYIQFAMSLQYEISFFEDNFIKIYIGIATVYFTVYVFVFMEVSLTGTYDFQVRHPCYVFNNQ